MLIDQDEINALLAQADELTAEAQEELAAVPSLPPAAQPNLAAVITDERVARLLRIRVPVIAQLAYSQMSIRSVRNLSAGAIVEFDKSVDDDLNLLVNNRPIGRGHAVKTGENFGLRVTAISSATHRIKSMGA
ncbi:MAG: FliM/FliN family flagellar motor C-terminal domain-containing protein [Planctomycetes bacterium]|nr:FliM/FliN family flagellar motor C-terminal domain-containing protein [Planctomycetota bacterium]